LVGESYDLTELRRINPSAIVVTISPYGETGPQANDPATDLTLFFASGISRQLTGQVDDLSEAPIRPVGEQSAFIGGLAAACAGMHAAQGNQSVRPSMCRSTKPGDARHDRTRTRGLGHKSWERKRLSDGNGATVTILPASDGYVAISPREERQWTSWLKAMRSPVWGADPRFVSKAERVKNWDALHAADVAMEPATRQANGSRMRRSASMYRAFHCATSRSIWTRHKCGIADTTGLHNLAGKAFKCRARRWPQCRRVGPQTANAGWFDAVVGDACSISAG